MGETVEIFLSYNRRDAADCQRLATGLQGRGVKPFKDDWYLKPGDHWPSVLERRLADCKAVAVLIGANGLGPWQQREVYAAIEREVKDQGRSGFRVIPVVLAGGESYAGVGFLAQNVWVEADDPRALDLIMGALNGTPPADLYDDARPDPRTLICPYRGLGVFREEDQAFYFGREADVEKLVAAVGDYPVVAIVGASGSGKSSLARAGLFPRLRRQTDGRVWQVLEMTPGTDPFLSLARALLPLREPERYLLWNENDIDDEADRLAERLTAKHAPHLLYVLEQVLKKEPGTSHLLLLVDQWEELYTYRPENAVPFIKTLIDAARQPGFQVVLTVRADYWGEVLNHHPPLGVCLAGAATVHLPALRRDGLKAVICKPAELARLVVTPDLVEALLSDAEDQPGDLPLLEFALRELWSTRGRNGGAMKMHSYEDMGRLEKAIVTRADAAYKRLMTQEERDAVPGVFTALVHVGEARADLRRRARLKELSPAGQAVARRFADERLLVTSSDETTRDAMVEVAHEALLRHWPKLKDWIDERRGALLTIRQLQADTCTWIKKDRSTNYLWSNERVREAVAALGQLADIVLSGEEREFLGPIDPAVMVRDLDVRETSHERRALIGDRLALFVDPREGVGLRADGLPDIVWRRIDGGEVTIEIRKDPNDLNSEVVDRQTRSVSPFWMARYPVTVSQFRVFLAECHRDGEWRLPPGFPIELPASYPPPKPRSRLDNHPVDAVNWYDACAFCHWLGTRLGCEVRLPTEFEWQFAATGGDSALTYPWGADWDPGAEPWRANTFGSDLGRSAAVGLYPLGASRADVLDLAGTIWEWCSNQFDEPDVSEFSTSNAPRVLRGGSWNGSRDGARSVSRGGLGPGGRDNDIGFRVVCSSPSSGH